MGLARGKSHYAEALRARFLKPYTRDVVSLTAAQTAKKKKKKSSSGSASAQATFSATTGQPAPATATTTATDTQINTVQPRATGYVAPKVEEILDDE